MGGTIGGEYVQKKESVQQWPHLLVTRVGRRTLFLVSYFVAFVSLCMASAAMIYGGEFEDDGSSSKEDWSCGPTTSGPKNQVWHKTQSMTPKWGSTFLFHSS